MQPVGSVVPRVGNGVALDVNDAGRVALGGTMGPEIGQIEGRLVQHDNAEYLVAVTAVHLLRGGEQPWAGEQIRVKDEYVSGVYQRTFSPGRTIALTAVGVAAVAWMLRHTLFPAGVVNDTTNVGDTSILRRVPIRPGRIPRSLGPVRPTPLLVPHLSRP